MINDRTDSAHQPEDEEREYREHVHEQDLWSLEVTCRSLLANCQGLLSDKLQFLIEQLALALQGCPTCGAILGGKHVKPCLTLRDMTVLYCDLDAQLRHNAPQRETDPF